MAHEPHETAPNSIHQSVLLQEVLEGLPLNEGDMVLDGTINGGGHSEALAKEIGSTGTLLGMDLDAKALKRAEKRLEQSPARILLAQDDYRNMEKAAHEHGIQAFNAILLDLGFSSDQLEHSGRGFSFLRDEPLLMTLRDDPDQAAFTARDIVNEWTESQIADILHGYGEERFARRIASAVVEARKDAPIETTFDLVRIIQRTVPRWYRFSRLHPATKTFQALRITVNDEIESLRKGIEHALHLLAPSGRLAVISFQSIEDRIVKRAFERAARDGEGVVITKKPVTARSEEVKKNPRTRSAKLRIFESRAQ